jgi:predicted phage tail protein
MNALTIRGSKGGSDSAHTPVESPDSLINTSYANILDGISEGPIVGLVNGAQSIFLDQTPLAGADGSMNFSGVTWEQRYGDHDQDYITGFPSVESEHAVGVELTNSQAWTQSLSNLQLSGVRLRLGASSLFQQNSDGDTNGFTVNYVIELSTDGGSFAPVVTSAFTGKTTTGYQRSHRIDLPAAEEGWSVRVRRTTPDSADAKIGDTTTIVSYTEVIDAKLQYPYTALVGLKIDASQFSNIPERAYRIRGRIIQVPSNYEPSSRTYSGTWDGTFKLAWTDCPPWIYRDIILNDRYGLGRFISSDNVDKWELYQIAQYCDALLDDGKGGMEPRFTCNLYLQSRADALQVLQDMASIFRGMAYYAGSQVIASADMPSDPMYTYTNSNVIGGMFSRVGSSGSTRYSVAKVSWTDRDNFGAQRVEYVQNQQSIARYGVRETEITAFGCVSQGQAQRLGHYTLLTNQLETGTIQFSVGLDGTLARPGQIVRVADQHYAGKPIGGRVKSSTVGSITVDDDLTVAAGDTLVVIQPNGVAQTRIIRSVAGRVVSVTSNFDAAPIAESVYAIETAEVVPETYRILTIAENFGDDKLQYDIVAVQHNASKFAAIDSGAQIVTPPTTILPGALQALPTNVKLSTYDAVKQGLTVATMRITWDQAKGAQSYNVWWKKDSGDWIYAGITYTAAMEVPGVYSGTYTARVSAVGVNGNASLWAYSEPTILQGKIGLPPAVTSITTESLLFGIGVHWTFPSGAEDTQRTELWYSPGTDVTAATKLSDLAYPQSDYVLQNLRAGAAFFFWARLVDRTGNIGPFYPAGVGVRGEASSDAGAILDQIAGEVGKSALGQELAAEIELITGTGPGSVNERVQEARDQLGEQIAAVDGELGNVKAELQGQIDAIADLSDSMPYKPDQTYTAGQSVLGDDGIIYQASKAVPVGTPPPNTEYWLNVGQAVATANGLAARVQTVETKVTSVEGVNTAQAQQITGLRTDVDGKASASSVQSLGNRVTTAEGSISSQGTAITGLNNSLTATNNNVTAAQTAANNAATLAGSKGKVLVQAAAPAAADQLAQNLWIDITGGTNTPKRWNGSAWAAVTDKVATDAATAAANALAVANTKADASTVQSLSNTVTQLGTDLTAAGSAITSINTSLASLGGENFVYNPSFDTVSPANATLPEGWTIGSGAEATFVSSLVASTLDPLGKAWRAEVAIPAAGGVIDSNTAARSAASDSQVFTLSVHARGTAGLGLQLTIQFRNAASTLIGETNSGNIAVSEVWGRYKLTSTPAPVGTTQVNLRIRTRQGPTSPATSGFMEYDRVKLELGATMSGWSDSVGVIKGNITTQAAATTALTGRVTQTETGLTSVSGQLTQLNNSIGSMGGDNLLANSSFEQLPAGVNDRPLYWRTGSSASAAPTLTFVDSPLSSSTKAVRLTRAALANGGYIDLNWQSTDGDRPKVVEGQSYTLSVYARLSSPSARLATYIQWMNSAGTVISTSQLAETQVGTTFARFSFTAVAPAGAVAAQVWAGRLLNRSGAAADMWIELDNVQFQEGTTATAYSASVQAVASAQAATSAAVDSLSSSVSQQGNTLTSVGARTTTLENAVNSTTNGLATKASASAVDTISNRVTAVEGVNTSQSNSIVDLNNSVSTIQGSLGASGLDPAADAVWQFDTSVEGWTVSGGTISASGGKLVVASSGSDPYVMSPTIAVPGALYTLVRVRVTRTGGAGWDGRLFYRTAGHSWGAYYKNRTNPNLAVGQSITLEYDMAALDAGGADWISNTILGLRLDLGSTAADTFEVDWIAVGRSAPAASSRALNSLSSTVTQQGTTQTAQAQQITSLQTSVGSVNTAVQTEATARSNADTALGRRVDTVQSSLGDTNASVQQTSTALSTLDGKVNAQYSVKVMTTSGGLKVAAGFGLGLESDGGLTQSTFAVSADRFVVLPSNLSGTLSSPFAVENGQVFLADAYIKKATITNGVIGQTLQSAQYTVAGYPRLRIDFDSGQIIYANRNNGSTYRIDNDMNSTWIIDNVVRVRIGSW